MSIKRNKNGTFKKGNGLRDLTGNVFFRLKVIKKSDFKKNNIDQKTYWECLCECGTTVIVRSDSLVGGKTKSCGCWNTDKQKTHGMTNTKLHHTWEGMKARCYNQNNTKYNIYGGRGIKVCDAWLNNFINFYNWAIENGYTQHLEKYGSKNTTLDRINPDGNYDPSNCRWATIKEQNQNRKPRK